jgi:prepilin-type N-terminal cleavage/methylation domain-containing protein
MHRQLASDARKRTAVASSGAKRAGFTLAELIVVLAVSAVVAALVVQTLSVTRTRTRQVACTDILRGFGESLAMYTTDHNGWLPGTNTSGVTLRARLYGILAGDEEALNDSALPVQPLDWMTPILIYQEPDLPKAWAERFHTLLTEWECPQQPAHEVQLTPPPGAPESVWRDIEELDWPGTSYVMPAHFQYWGSAQEGRELARMEGYPAIPVLTETIPEDWEVRNPDYTSRLDAVGPPNRKIFVADGTRYLTGDGTQYLDLRLFATRFGAFATSGAWWSGSTAFGVRQDSPNWDNDLTAYGSPSDGLNLSYTYRHSCGPGVGVDQPGPEHLGSGLTGSGWDNPGCINTVFYDGHVETLNDRDSRSIEMWYPSGAVVNEPSMGMTTEEAGTIIP